MSYDRADFDYSSEAEALPKGHAATHIGMFLGWAAVHDPINTTNNHREKIKCWRSRRLRGFAKGLISFGFLGWQVSPKG